MKGIETMKSKRIFRFVTPRELDERAQSLQLLVIRDTFIAILLMGVVFVLGLALFPVFVKAHLGEIGTIAVVSVGLVAWISNHLRGAQIQEQKILFAKGDLLIAPFLAAIVVFLNIKLTGGEVSLPEWLLSYGAILLGFLVYPLFLLLRRRYKQASMQVQSPPDRDHDA